MHYRRRRVLMILLPIYLLTYRYRDKIYRFLINGQTGKMAGDKPRVLVATDCLSEGINLQELFTGVLHYDLPWNPNRLEQREGRPWKG